MSALNYADDLHENFNFNIFSLFFTTLLLLLYWHLHLVLHLDLVIYSSRAKLILTVSENKTGYFSPDSDFPQAEHMCGR